jgi:VanZ family protein
MNSVVPAPKPASPPLPRRASLRWLGLSIAFAAITLVVSLALMTDPEIKKVPLLPRDFAVFFDRHDFLKNFTGFAALRLVTGVTLAPWLRPMLLSFAVAALIVILEITQLFLPKRNFDWLDIVAGVLGVALVAILSRAISFLRKILSAPAP